MKYPSTEFLKLQLCIQKTDFFPQHQVLKIADETQPPSCGGLEEPSEHQS